VVAADLDYQQVAICQAVSKVVVPVRHGSGIFDLIHETRAEKEAAAEAAAMIANPTEVEELEEFPEGDTQTPRKWKD
jgi:hypothetical protein